MMKSFRCRPPILCVHQVTVTLPHSVNSAGWCPSSSACSPTLLVKASASAKLRNLNTRSKRLMPSRCTRSEEHTSELQSRQYLVCRLLLEKKKNPTHTHHYHCLLSS